MIQGLYIDFKRLTIHDGPGLRSTLFMKGCPLHCLWCHNPESIDSHPTLGFYADKCILCGNCTQVCDCHQIVNGRHLYDRDQCVACGKCADVCPTQALELYGRPITVDEAMKMALSDRLFYHNSGGGVTVSGGEPLLQADFCAEFFERLHADGIHTAVDTCGNVPWEAFVKVIPYTDLFLYDFKEADNAKHREYTGHGNKLILKNLQRLDEAGCAIEIRMPLIPGLNDTDTDLNSAGEFLSRLKHLTGIRVLPYHGYAKNKYVAVGREFNLTGQCPPSADKMDAVKKCLQTHHLSILED